MSKSTITVSCLLAVILLLTGCASLINRRNAAYYMQAGIEAERQGDDALAGRNFQRAYLNTQLGHLGPAAEAYALYNQARMDGYQNLHKNADDAFQHTLELIDQAQGEADDLRAPALSEYARYLHDTGQPERAIRIYPEALAALGKTDVEKEDPVGFADFLDDYVQSLRDAGQSDEAEAIARRASALRQAHPGATAEFQFKRYPPPGRGSV